MIRAFFRLLAMLAVAVAVIMAVLDATRTVAAQALVTTPLLTSWEAAAPRSLDALQNFVTERLAGFLWDPVLTSLLGLPGFVVMGLVAFLLYAIGHKPKRRIGRFVIED